MPYNVTSCKTKSLEELAIPVASLYKHERTDWHPERMDHDSGLTVFWVGKFQITGTVQDGWLHVGDIHGSGECSGTAMDWIFEPALADSTGRLVAVRIWEGGDSIDRLTVVDGVVTIEPIEL